MNMIRCVAIDNDAASINILKEYCEQYGDIDLKCFASPLYGLEYIAETRPDIVFLEIEMQQMSGLELAGKLPGGVGLIFTTALTQYAIEGFELNAIDYLQKPLLYSRFATAMGKAKQRLRIDDETITLKVEHQKVIVNLSEINYIEAMDNYVKIHRDNLPPVMTLMPMKEIATLLPGHLFVRVHRSFIVAIQKVESIGGKGLRVRGEDVIIPVGRTFINNCRQIVR